MKIVGLTGGIGSGKSTVANFFKELGVPIYIADKEAKRITNKSKVVRRKIIHLLGEESYTEQGINSAFVASKVFNNKELLSKINAIIHPKVRQHFTKWVKKQVGHYCIKEAAILFENGGYKHCDSIILITAPKKVRIERVLARDNTTLQEIESRIENQWEDDKKIPLADYVIENTDLIDTKKQVKKIHNLILKR